MVTINNKFKLGSFVYIVHDPEHKRMIVSIEVYLDGSFLYKVSGVGESQYCNERELETSEQGETVNGL